MIQDGDYNKPIPEQYSEELNKTIKVVPGHSDGFSGRREQRQKQNMLCSLCSQNQLLKIKQLSAFVPFNDVNIIFVVGGLVYNIYFKSEKLISGLQA